MGRIVDLCGEVAAAADEGPDGLVLPAEAWGRLREGWSDEDIEDALGFVKDSLLQSELVEAADSLSARLVEVLSGLGLTARHFFGNLGRHIGHSLGRKNSRGAVWMPPSPKEGWRLASFSGEVSGRIPSSCANDVSTPSSVTGTGMISRTKRPSSRARAAFMWLS